MPGSWLHTAGLFEESWGGSMGLLTRIRAGNKLHAKGLSSKHSNVRMLVSGGGRATETSKRGRGSLGVREWEACAALRGQGKRRNTRALGDGRAGTKEEQPGPCGSLSHSQCLFLPSLPHFFPPSLASFFPSSLPSFPLYCTWPAPSKTLKMVKFIFTTHLLSPLLLSHCSAVSPR